MTEHEMLEAAKYIAQRDDEMHIAKILITTQAAAIAKALEQLELARQAIHQGDRISTPKPSEALGHVTDAMTTLTEC